MKAHQIQFTQRRVYGEDLHIFGNLTIYKHKRDAQVMLGRMTEDIIETLKGRGYDIECDKRYDADSWLCSVTIYEKGKTISDIHIYGSVSTQEVIGK